MSSYTTSAPRPPRSRNNTARRMSRKALGKTLLYSLLVGSFLAVPLSGSLFEGNLLLSLFFFCVVGGGVIMAAAWLTHAFVIGSIEEELGRNRDAAADSVGNPHINISPYLYEEFLQASSYLPTFRLLPFVNIVVTPIASVVILVCFNIFGVFVLFLWLWFTAWFLTRFFNTKPKTTSLDEEDVRRANKAWRNAKRYLDDDDDDDDDDEDDDDYGETIR